MKFDKQNLIKNRFWLLLGLFGLAFVIGGATLALGNPLGTEEKDYKKATDDLKNNANPKHEATYVPRWNAHMMAFKAQKEKAWELAWTYQKNLLTWPVEGLSERWAKGGSSANFKAWVDAQQADSQKLGNELGSYRDDYKLQFKGLDQKVAPAVFKFDGDLRDFEQMMAPATSEGGVIQRAGPKGLRGTGPALPGSGAGPAATGRSIVNLWDRKLPLNLEEAWIAQEDFCVKKQFLEAIGSTIKSAASLQRGPAGFWSGMAADDTVPDGAVARFRGHNSRWELDLIFVRKSADDERVILSNKSTLKNVDVDRRILNVSSVPDERINKNGTLRFRVLYRSNKSEIFDIRGKSLAWGEWSLIDITGSDIFFTPAEITGVDQVLDWYSSPVRIIEDVRIPALSHRMADLPLKPGLGFITAPPPEEPRPTPPTGPGQGRPAVPPPDANPGPPPVSSATDVNKLDRLRYIYVTEQSRHLPFGIALVVEKNHVPEILSALANTPLRVQITQVGVQRVRGVVRNRNEPPTANTINAARDDDANLVELVIYGICTLYERVPDKTEKPKQ